MKDNTEWTDEKLLAAIRGGSAEREAAFVYIYKDSGWRPWVLHHVRTNDGYEEDGKEVFTLTAALFDEKLRKPDFVLRSTLRTFFYGLAKGVWFNVKRKRRPPSEPMPDGPDHDSDIEKMLLTEERKRFIHGIIGKMDKTCRELLPLWMLSFTNKEIAQELGLTSEERAKNYTYRCREKFKEFLKRRGGLP